MSEGTCMVSRFMVSVERLRFASVRRYMHGVNVHGVSREAEVCKCQKVHAWCQGSWCQ